MALRHVIPPRNLRVSLADVHNQGIFDAEDGIRSFVRITAEV